MLGRKKKKGLAAAVVLGMVMSVLTGCGEMDGSTRNNAEQKDKIEQSVTYSLLSQTTGLEGTLTACVAYQEDWLYSVMKHTAEEPYQLYRIQDSDKQQISASRLEEGYEPEQISVSKDGSIWMVGQDSAHKQMLYGIAETGEELLYKPLTEWVSDGQFLVKLLTDQKGQIALVLNVEVILLDQMGTSQERISCDGVINNATVSKDGALVCGVESMAGVSAWLLDANSNTWRKKTSLDTEALEESASMINGAVYDFYYRDNDGIYGYDYVQDQAVLVLDYNASDIVGSEIMDCVAMNEGCFLIRTNATGYHIYAPVPKSEQTNKITMTVGVMGVTQALESTVAKFNSEQKDFHIEMRDYAEYEEPDTQMMLDLTTGKGPDILSMEGKSISEYQQKGVLEDLTPYYEQDSDVSSADYLDSVLEAVQSADGIYYVASGFQLYTIMANQQDVGDITGWTTGECATFAKQKKQKLFYLNMPNEILGNFMVFGLHDYINWDTGKVSFDSDAFRSLLVLAKENGSEIAGDTDKSRLQMIQDRELLAVKLTSMNIWDLIAYMQAYDGNGCFVGYPCDDRQGNYFRFVDQYAINRRSEHKDAAWEFIKIFISKDYQYTNNMTTSYPTRKDVYEMLRERYLAQDSYTDAMGNIITPIKIRNEIDDVSYEFDHATQEQVAMLDDLIAQTHKACQQNDTLYDMIMEEAGAYFADARSLEETVTVIQKRVETYVNENR